MIRVDLTQGFSTVIDPEYEHEICRFRWKILRASGKLYACRTRKVSGRSYRTILMHREILAAPRGVLVDHIDGDGLNNTRANLRLCNGRQNLANRVSTRGRSRFKGVYWNKDKALWQAQIGCGFFDDGRQRTIYLGRFEREEDAALAYDRKAIEFHGEFARTNILPAPPPGSG